MFIKTTRSGKYEYLQIVSSKRVNGVTRHDVLMNLGRKDEVRNNPLLKKLVIKLSEITGLSSSNSFSDLSSAVIRNWGYVVYKVLWKSLKLDTCLENIRTTDSKAKFNLSQTTFLMVIQHLLNPMSKLKTFNHQSRYVKLPELKLQHLYRSLDILSKSKDEIEKHIFSQNYDLFNCEIDVVFYDVTTFYFESVKQNDLKDFGYSKDNKFKEVQVVMGLLIDQNGFPIGYELFPGNTFDGSTMIKALNNLKKRFGIRRVIIVADRGLNSKINLKMIKDANYGYIVASRIRKMNDKIRKEILSPEGYFEMQVNSQGKGFNNNNYINNDSKSDNNNYISNDSNSKNNNKNGKNKSPEKLLCKVMDYVNTVKDQFGIKHELDENLIITYSEKRLTKDRADRERLIEKTNKLLNRPGIINANIKRSGLKYLKSDEDELKNIKWLLDEEGIEKDELLDGYYGIQTSEKNIDIADILDSYHTLWKIEESFRIMKNTLEVRPIFHWTENRIKGHFVVCFLSFLLERKLESRLISEGITEASPDRTREALNSLEFAEVEMNNNRYYIKTKGTDLSNKILKTMHIQTLKNVLTPDEFDV